MTTTSTSHPPPLPKCPGIIRGQRYMTGHAVVTIDGCRLYWRDSLAILNHSPTGIEWGYMGAGPTQLALALLLQVTDLETARTYCQRFRDGAIRANHHRPMGHHDQRHHRLAETRPGIPRHRPPRRQPR